MVERGSWTGETRPEKSVEIFGFCDVYNLFMRVFLWLCLVIGCPTECFYYSNRFRLKYPCIGYNNFVRTFVKYLISNYTTRCLWVKAFSKGYKTFGLKKLNFICRSLANSHAKPADRQANFSKFNDIIGGISLIHWNKKEWIQKR